MKLSVFDVVLVPPQCVRGLLVRHFKVPYISGMPRERLEFLIEKACIGSFGPGRLRWKDGEYTFEVGDRSWDHQLEPGV